jgi:16S rRNA (cytosine967-C5)-methyltransferase
MVVDFCAGAGGKTLALGAAMRNTGRLYAFDVSGHRLDALKPRLARSGLSNVHPAQIAHERDERIKRLAGKIDRVLVDAPCSGLGTLRRNPDLKWRQSPQAVAELQAKQQGDPGCAARLLKPGGRLVYATCSLLAAENEEVAAGLRRRARARLRAAAGRRALARTQVERAGESLVSGPWLRCGRTGTRPTAFSLRCGSGAETAVHPSSSGNGDLRQKACISRLLRRHP